MRTLAVLAGTLLLNTLVLPVVLIALPGIRVTLGLSAVDSGLVLAAFPAGLAAALLPGRRLVRRYAGAFPDAVQERVFLGALVVFGMAAVCGGLATHPAVLVVALAVQGGCAAQTVPVLAAAGRWAGLAGASGVVLGLLSSGLLSTADWRWALLLPAPVAFGLAWAGSVYLPVAGVAGAPLPATRPGATAGTGRAGGPATPGAAAVAAPGVPDAAPARSATPGGTASAGHGPAQPTALGGAMPSEPTLRDLLRHRLLLRAALAAACLGGATTALLLILSAHLSGTGHPPWLTALLLTPAALTVPAAVLLTTRVPGRLPPPARPLAGLFAQTAVQLGAVLAVPAAAALLTTGVRPALYLVGAIGALGLLAGPRPSRRSHP
ncbi:hypothetical protein JOF53_001270 [Crossiella equi]|uniref:Major Facilitator Superfamily protein n=1 Tax=Crossiella equi TaxID=130796 RepID=A0ABS5A732_9PSEU|nr:MFS transporter [Crossiella equi]MBP2472398.1 hypothetical protein [Crossiella equi]